MSLAHCSKFIKLTSKHPFTFKFWAHGPNKMLGMASCSRLVLEKMPMALAPSFWFSSSILGKRSSKPWFFSWAWRFHQHNTSNSLVFSETNRAMPWPTERPAFVPVARHPRSPPPSSSARSANAGLPPKPPDSCSQKPSGAVGPQKKRFADL